MRKIICPECNTKFVPLRNHSVYCSDKCRSKAYNQRRNAKQREQTKSVKPVIEPYQSRTNKYKSPISDAEQKAHDMALRQKYAIEPGPVKVYTREEIEAIMPELTPPDRMRNLSPLYGLCSSQRERWC